MWKYIKWLFRGVGLILCIFGIGGILDDMQIWSKWIELIFGNNDININVYLNHDLLKYAFVFAGLFLIFISYIRKQKNADIQFEYDENDKKFYYREGAEQTHRIYIENMTGKTIENTKVEITGMRPLHPVFTNKLPVLKSFNFGPCKEPIDVIRLLYRNKREMYQFIEFESTMQTYFLVSDKGHEITVTISGEKINPISKNYKFGIQRKHKTNDKFWFNPADQT